MAKSAGKEDPVELDSSPTLWSEMRGVVISGRFVASEIPLLLSSLYLFGYAAGEALPHGFGVKFRTTGLERAALKTVSGGEFDWGGTSFKR